MTTLQRNGNSFPFGINLGYGDGGLGFGGHSGNGHGYGNGEPHGGGYGDGYSHRYGIGEGDGCFLIETPKPSPDIRTTHDALEALTFL